MANIKTYTVHIIKCNIKPANKYKDWLDFWEKKKNKKAVVCRYCSSKSNDLTWACVMCCNTNGMDHDIYIVPICQKCTNHNEAFEVIKKDLVFSGFEQ